MLTNQSRGMEERKMGLFDSLFKGATQLDGPVVRQMKRDQEFLDHMKELTSRPYLQSSLEPAISAGASAHDLQRGDHVYTYRTVVNAYTHHGIYVGDGMLVHYAGLSRNGTGSSICLGLGEFRSENGEERKIYIAKYKPDARYSREEIVKRAMSRLGEDDYSVIFNNCEHFASWCVTGIETCYQLGDKNVLP